MSHTTDIQVLFEDPAVLVINKPAGLATLPDGYNPSLPHIKTLLEQRYGRLWIVHRLDKDTSGALLLARSAEAHRSLNTQFEQHTVMKVYHALVVGSPKWKEKTIDLPLLPNGDRQHRTIVDLQHGKPAITHLKVLERFDHSCLLEAVPETGRTHQIRAHLSALGLAIVGDKLYAQRRVNQNDDEMRSTRMGLETLSTFAAGMGLHARHLEFNHPTSGDRLKFTAPYPPSWLVVLEQLKSLIFHG